MRKALILSIVLFTLLSGGATAAPPVAELLRWVPADAQVVVGIDAATLRTHPSVQGWLLEHQARWSGADDDLARFVADAGLDPARDIDAIVVAARFAGQHDRGVAAFAGRFNAAPLAAALVARGGTAVSLGPVQAVLFAGQQPHRGEPVLVAFPVNGVAVAGGESVVRGVLASRPTAPGLAQREAALRHVDLAAHFWLVAVVPAEMRSKAAASHDEPASHADPSVRGVMTASGTVQRVTLQAMLSDRLVMHAWGQSDTAENAGLLRDAIKGALAAVRLEAGASRPDLVDVLRAVNVAQDGAEVTVDSEVPTGLLEKLIREPDAQGQARVQ